MITDYRFWLGFALFWLMVLVWLVMEENRAFYTKPRKPEPKKERMTSMSSFFKSWWLFLTRPIRRWWFVTVKGGSKQAFELGEFFDEPLAPWNKDEGKK